MTKRIFIASAVFLTLVIGAIFVYNFAFKNNKAQDKTETTSNPSPVKEESTPTTSNVINSVSSEPIYGPTAATGSNSVYLFNAATGQLNQVDQHGKLEKVLSTDSFNNIVSAKWNKQKNKAILKTRTGDGNFEYYYLDIANRSSLRLKSNIDSIVWSGQGDKIIYKFYDSRTKKRTITISDPDGKNWRDLTTFDYFGVSIGAQPASSDITFWPEPNAFTKTSINSISIRGDGRKELIRDRFGADLLWSPDGNTIAISYTDQKGGHKTDLALANSQGGEFRSLFFPTFASKCTWSKDSTYLYCAMPGNIPESAILPNDWQEDKIKTTDTLWRIEAATGKKDRLVDPEKINGSYDILNPFLSDDEADLYFVNKSDGKLYRVDL